MATAFRIATEQRFQKLNTKSHGKHGGTLEDHLEETTGHYSIHGFQAVEHLAAAPRHLKGLSDWQTDPILIRKIAADYPPLAKSFVDKLTSPDYSADEIYTDYDEPVEGESRHHQRT